MLLTDGKGIQSRIENAIKTITQEQPQKFSVTGKLITVPSNKEVIILGDLHGDNDTLQKIIQKTNFMNHLKAKNSPILICLGDYIDRGPKQLEVMSTLLDLITSYPENIILLRGNHEGPRDISVSPHDFPDVLHRRIGKDWEEVYNSFRDLFDEMYTACLIENRALLLHGGIPTEAEGLEEIAWAHMTHPETTHLEEILWSDLSTTPGVTPSFRGRGRLFGIDVTEQFLDKIGVELLVRGHECYEEGYHVHRKALTLFSCILPVYRNKKAAYVYAQSENMSMEYLYNYIHTV